MITLALVLTPVASARALAGICALGAIDADIIPTSRGAVAVRAVGAPAPTVPDDASALLDAEGGAFPGERLDDDGAPDGDGLAGAADPWDIGELLADDVPAEARALAAALSRLARDGVILLTAKLAEDSGLEPGLSGQIKARRYVAGEPGDEVPAGLILAAADDVIEDLLLGRCGVADVPGHVSSRDVSRGRAGRWVFKGLRRPRP